MRIIEDKKNKKVYLEFSNKLMIFVTITVYFVFICLFIMTGQLLWQFYKEADLIRTDPLIYGLKAHNFTNCQCFDTQGKVWDQKGEVFIHTRASSGLFTYDREMIDEFTMNLNQSLNKSNGSNRGS